MSCDFIEPKEGTMASQRPKNLSTLQVRVAFEPNRFEHSALQSAYERLVPVMRRALAAHYDTVVTAQRSESSTARRKEVRL